MGKITRNKVAISKGMYQFIWRRKQYRCRDSLPRPFDYRLEQGPTVVIKFIVLINTMNETKRERGRIA